MSHNSKELLSILGARGSIPVSGANYSIYGCATSCVLLEVAGLPLIFDAGSGLLNLPERVLEQEQDEDGKKEKKRLSIFLSHYHLDHLIGLTMSGFLFDPKAEITFYTPDFLSDAHAAVSAVFREPLWPVCVEDFCADIRFCRIGRDGLNIPDSPVSVRVLDVPHPNGGSAFRIDWQKLDEKKSIVYATDCELDGQVGASLQAFAAGAQLLIVDAQYTDEEYVMFRGYGHSTMRGAAQLAKQCGVAQCLLFHHAPQHTDQQLAAWEAEIKKDYPNICFAKEGSVIAL